MNGTEQRHKTGDEFVPVRCHLQQYLNAVNITKKEVSAMESHNSQHFPFLATSLNADLKLHAMGGNRHSFDMTR